MGEGREAATGRDGRIGVLMLDTQRGMFAPQYVHAALLRLLADPEYRRLLGRKAREWIATRFSQERVARDLGRFYETLLGGGGMAGQGRAVVQA